MRKMSDYVIAIGVACMDEYYTMSRWPERGDKSVMRKGPEEVGGMIPNAACVLAQNGVKTYLLDTMRDGLLTQRILNELRSWGVDTSYVIQDPQAADARCIVILTGDERTILVVDSNRPSITPEPALAGLLENAAYLYGASYNFLTFSDSKNYIKTLLEQGVKLAMDVEDFDMSSAERYFFGQASVLFFNQYGFKQYLEWTKKREQESVNSLLKGTAEAVVVTLGKGGCRCYSRDDRVEVKALELEVVDTTGAGDTFNAAFLSRWMRGCSLQACAEYANLASNRAVTIQGARAGAVPEEQVLAWWRERMGEES